MNNQKLRTFFIKKCKETGPFFRHRGGHRQAVGCCRQAGRQKGGR